MLVDGTVTGSGESPSWVMSHQQSLDGGAGPTIGVRHHIKQNMEEGNHHLGLRPGNTLNDVSIPRHPRIPGG